MKDLKQELINNAARAGYLQALSYQAQAICVPIWWHGYSEPGNYRILHNGTVCFVDTGIRKLAITADHVIDQYLVDKKLNPSIACQFGGSTVDIEHRLVSRDQELDLAVIEVSEVMIGATGGYFHAPPIWHGAPLSEGEIILCGGYPGVLRKENIVTADMPFQWVAGRTTTVSAHNISFQLNFDEMQTPFKDKEDLNRFIGGMSGGPLLRYISSPIEHLEIVGFIYQYHESFELMLARPVQFISADGLLHSMI